MDKLFPLLVPLVLLFGIFLGDLIASWQVVVPWIFAGITFVGSLKMDVKTLRENLTASKSLYLTLLVLRILMPVWALLMGVLLFPSNPYTRMGLLLFALLPVGVNSVIWSVLYKGNIPLSLSIVLIDTLLSPFILPLSLVVLTGTRVELDTFGMMQSLFQMVVIPSVLGILVNQFSKGEFPKVWFSRLSPYSRIGLLLVILINGASVSDSFTSIDSTLIGIMVTVFMLATSGYVMAWGVAMIAKLGREDTLTVVFSGGMRNVGTGIVIAVAYFPMATTIPVITGILFQQIICSFFASTMTRYFNNKIKITQPLDNHF